MKRLSVLTVSSSWCHILVCSLNFSNILASLQVQTSCYKDNNNLNFVLLIYIVYYTIIEFNEVDIRIYLTEKVITHAGR